MHTIKSQFSFDGIYNSDPWKNATSFDKKMQMSQIPDSILHQLSTDQLVALCAKHPLNVICNAYDNPMIGAKYIVQETEQQLHTGWIPLRTDNTANVSKYWTNDVYIETTSNYLADKIVYYDSNILNDNHITHSAVFSHIDGYYESKWGSWPLVRHLPTEVPPSYGTTYRYFKHTIVPNVADAELNNSMGEIVNKNESISFTSELNFNISKWTKRVECYIEDTHEINAIDEGWAEIESSHLEGFTATFYRSKQYEVYMLHYNKFNELIARSSIIINVQ